jgi:hypothetical protein
MGLAQKSKNKSNGTVQYKKAPFFVMTRTSIARMVQIVFPNLLVRGSSLVWVVFGLFFCGRKKKKNGTTVQSTVPHGNPYSTDCFSIAFFFFFEKGEKSNGFFPRGLTLAR